MKKHKLGISLNKIKKINKDKERYKEKITNFLELPTSVLGNSTRISMVDDKQIFVEGSVKVEDYLDTYIKVKTNISAIEVEGKNLQIKELEDKELAIEGKIQRITYN